MKTQKSLLCSEVIALVGVGVALRAIVSLHSYSGHAKPPLHGDYEAQRHWQEITVNLPAAAWYKNSSANDLLYWGLDYPPLTAYHSYLMGRLARETNDSFVALESSRGIENEQHKSFMRLTVLLADLLVYIPAVLLLAVALERTFQRNMLLPSIAVALLYPGQLLIDNGHFQYNNISLGLAALAIAAVLRDRHYVAAFCFTLALNYKQMELYHALPFFVYLLRMCFNENSFLSGARKLFTIASIVLGTFAILWLPWLHSLDVAQSVLRRIFPVARGVFEDKVANVWCAVNVVYKLKQNFSNSQMALICLTTTVAAILPINFALFNKTGKDKFLYSLTNTAMAFFLFSFQVHEKSILLVALPALCLFVFKPLEVFWFLEVSTFSMFPLLVKDGLALPSFALSLIFHISIKSFFIDNFVIDQRKDSKVSTVMNYCYGLSISLMLALAATELLVPAPAILPFLWPLLNSLFSCGHFVIFLVFGVSCQFR